MRIIKAGETDSNLLKVYFMVYLLDNKSPALGEAGGQPQLSINGNTFSNNGISTLITIGFGNYYASLDPNYVLTAGDILIPRYAGSTTQESRAEPIQIVDPDTYVAPQDATPIQYYGSIQGGDTFFSERLNSDPWDNASINDKIKALTMATRAIDRLNFAGEKTDPAQILQFPRKNLSFLFGSLSILNTPQTLTNVLNLYTDETDVTEQVFTDDYGVYMMSKDTLIPNDIQNATYIIALKLLDGYDPDMEIENLSALQNRQGNAATSYDRSFVHAHIRAGIPSAEAWAYLRPYLRDPLQISLTRNT